jgi:ParB-like nuclease domain
MTGDDLDDLDRESLDAAGLHRAGAASLTAPTVRWRDTLPIHPACKLFPELSPEEIEELGADIKARGLLMPIIVFIDEEGAASLLDGRSRLDAMEGAGVAFSLSESKQVVRVGGPGGTVDPVEYVISANVRRRHLTSEQKRGLIETLLKLYPSKSDRSIAKLVGASHPKVAAVRRQAVERGEWKIFPRGPTPGAASNRRTRPPLMSRGLSMRRPSRKSHMRRG